jgi:protein involved in polysaccharide export with SLBB domain/uncharacterized membrane protein YgcG
MSATAKRIIRAHKSPGKNSIAFLIPLRSDSMSKTLTIGFVLLVHLSTYCLTGLVSSTAAQSRSVTKPSAKRFAPTSASTSSATSSAHVYDYGRVLDQSTSVRLEQVLRNLRLQAGIEFNIVTVQTTGGQDIFGFSRQIAGELKVSLKSTTSKTLVLVVAVREKTLFTQFTRAAQAELPDGILGEIRQRMQEPINSGRFNEGLTNGVQYFISAVAKKIGVSVKGVEATPTRVVEIRPAALQVAEPSTPVGVVTASANGAETRGESAEMTTQNSSPKPVAISSSPDSIPASTAASESETVATSFENAIDRSPTVANTEASRIKDDSSTAVALNTLREQPTPTDNYKIGVGDVLTIATLNMPSNRSTLYTVSEGGWIDFPPAGGAIVAAGLTVAEIQARLESEIKGRNENQEARLAVGVRHYASHTVTVTGIVSRPGLRSLKGETVPLYVIISEVQPRSEAGRVSIIRSDSTYNLDLHDPDALSFRVQPGDVINIAPRTQDFYYIGGGVKRPGQKAFQPGITVLQAIIAAGGLNHESDHKVEVLREGVDRKLKTMTFDLREIKSGKMADPRLQAGDSLEIDN